MIRLLEILYWAFSRLVYKRILRLSLGKDSKIVLGGSLKGKNNIFIGDNFFIGKGFMLATYKQEGLNPKLQIGNNVVAQTNVRITCMDSISIGNDVLFGSTILVSDNNHGIDPSQDISYAHQKCSTKPVFIGDGCWIGDQVIILAGSYIGKKCVIGAGSVVTGTIEDYSIAVGNPAHVIKKWNFEMGRWENI